MVRRAVEHAQLERLAQWSGVQTSYTDLFGRRRTATPEALLAILRALGCPVARLSEAPEALQATRETFWRRGCEPVVVAWGDTSTAVEFRLPAGRAEETLACDLKDEAGSHHTWTVPLSNVRALGAVKFGGGRYVLKRVRLPQKLSSGYHRLTVELDGQSLETLVIAAPRWAYPPPGSAPLRTWGVFLPLYALASKRNSRSGDFTDLATLVEWVGAHGGGVVATLPLLAAFLDEPYEPSPYMPASRLFWNEFYLDVTSLPELRRCEAARQQLEREAFQAEWDALRASPLVDYRRGMAFKRAILEPLAESFFSQPSPAREQAFHRFLETHPQAEAYARFRATCERHRRPWSTWPQRLREGLLQEGDYDAQAVRYHLYVQWNAHEQLHGVAELARRHGPGLYLDLPLGVHPHGYDVWRERDAFALEARTGAPPDPVFTSGQDWGFPPLHPERIRAQGYRYTIACLRHHLQQAGVLRLDHVMSLHRLFWIPEGVRAADGMYVRYRPEEFYAILALESRRAHAVIVGENLGTVPPEVNPAMASHRIHRMFVVQYELPMNPRRTFRRLTPDVVASLNTHDMPSFAASWEGRDIEQRARLGLLDERAARQEAAHRRTLCTLVVKALRRSGWLDGHVMDPSTVFQACLKFLSASRAGLVLVNLEDVWLERESQNIPGTQHEHPNWRRKARYALEAFSEVPGLEELLEQVARLRSRKGRG